MTWQWPDEAIAAVCIRTGGCRYLLYPCSPDHAASLITMTRASYRVLEQIPPALAPILAEMESLIQEPAEVFAPWPNQSSWVGRSARHFFYLADDDRGRARILLEARRLAWALDSGIPAPRVEGLSPDGAWVVTERVPDDLPAGPGFVQAALTTADAVATAVPPPELLAGSKPRRRPRHTVPLRLLRMAASPVSVLEFRSARSLAMALPPDTLAHGDFHSGNVLYDSRLGVARVTDMENLAFAPRGTDPLTLWCGLDRAEDRDAVIDRLLAGSDRAERARLGLLHHWLALRTLADVALETPSLRDERMTAEAIDRVREARAHARAWVA